MNGVSHFFLLFCLFLVKLRIQVNDLCEMMSKESKESEYSDVTFNENESVLFVLASLSYAQVREWRHSDKI